MQIGNYNIRAFVVTLQELPEKTAHIFNHFAEVGVQAEPFNGISAAESGLVTENTYEVDNPGSGYRIGRKPTCTWMSFYMMWSALNMQPDTHFMTLEWDAKFHPDWKERAAKALADVPSDFDLLYLGHCCTSNVAKRHIKGDVFDVKWPMCGHATIVAKKALPIMLETQRKIYAPLDISLAFHTFPKLKVYTVIPRMVDQFGTFLQD